MNNIFKNRKSKTMKRILLALAVLLVLIQFYRPAKNISYNQNANAVELHYNVPENVGALLKSSCYDCHSNTTKYPWYSTIQPIAFWLDSHVKDGKRHLNFDEFNAYTIEKKRKKLKEIAETIDNGEMPLSSYTLIHRNAKLTVAEKNMLIDWANGLSNGL